MDRYQQRLQQIQNKIFIDGKYQSCCSERTFQAINPSTQETIASFATASAKDVDLAVEAAKRAFDSAVWRQLHPHERGRMLSRLADLIQQNLDLLAYFETLNSGKTLAQCKNQDVPYSAYIYRYFAGQTDKIKGSTLSTAKHIMAYTKKQPIGVVAQIIPWNYPLLMMAWKVAPALAAGCTVVLKPAEQTPITALLVAELFNQAGFPAGVLNIVTGMGETGACLSQHKLISKVSFTGSTQVGYLIMRNSHKHSLRPVTLELGGKSANIILPDADLQEAVTQACILFSNCGQSCVAGSRTYVHQSIYEQFVKRCIVVANSIQVGDPMLASSQQGAIVCKQQFEKVMSYIELGKKEAVLVAGGERVGKKGYFIRPTIFKDVNESMRIGHEEIFGPVMSIFKWSNEEDVIKRANSLPYGLGAGVVTKDIDKALKFTEELNAGSVYVNCYDYQQGSTPFGGVKDSGIGKDLGDEGLEGYLVTKTVVIRARL